MMMVEVVGMMADDDRGNVAAGPAGMTEDHAVRAQAWIMANRRHAEAGREVRAAGREMGAASHTAGVNGAGPESDAGSSNTGRGREGEDQFA
jgi:hypothetical protein